MSILDWPAIRAACDREAWQMAYGSLPLCRGKDDTIWQEAATYIEARKAEALARLTLDWRTHHAGSRRSRGSPDADR
jgi:hypothetical protein